MKYKSINNLHFIYIALLKNTVTVFVTSLNDMLEEIDVQLNTVISQYNWLSLYLDLHINIFVNDTDVCSVTQREKIHQMNKNISWC